MEIITINENNIKDQHICCGFSDKKCSEGYELKKELVRQRLADGYKFKKFDVRGKVFIDYVPAEHAWAPIEADGYLFIQCFWVSGQFKGQGLGKKLLAQCMHDAKDTHGIIAISSEKKKPFLTDKKFYIKNGFEVCDQAGPYFELLVKRNSDAAPLPQFKKQAVTGTCDNKTGFTVYYSNMCPFSEYYTNVEFKAIADAYGIPVQFVKLTTVEEARNCPTPFPIYSIYYRGKFLTHEIMTRKRFDKIWDKLDK